MQTKLTVLRGQLQRLRQMRSAVRWANAMCIASSILLWIFAGTYLCDWLFNLSWEARGIILAASVVGGILAVVKLAWPFLAVHESIEDMALIVEHELGIQNDLVAAIQFEDPKAASWGSSALENALIDGVASRSPSLEIFHGFRSQELPKRACVLGFSLLLVIGGVIVWPNHAAAFLNRIQFKSDRYPTRTTIESVTIDGQPISLDNDSTRSRIQVPFGRSVQIAVKCGNELPSFGTAQITSQNDSSTNLIRLLPLPSDLTILTSQLTRVTDSIRLILRVGDVRLPPIDVIVIPLPMVDLHWEVTPPRYARAAANETNPTAYQIAVLHGSSVKLDLVCANKLLKSARLSIANTSFDLVPSDRTGETSGKWTLPPGTPFERVRDMFTYEVQVVDQDGLSLERPIAGQIRLKTDRVPQITSSAVTQFVLPTAQPKIDYAATDDFGLSKIVAHIRISHENGETALHELPVRTISETEQPLTEIRGQFAIPLARFNLVKGDEVQVVMEVTDWRGELKGDQVASEPRTFNVTDLNGILNQIGEQDKKSIKQLDEILQRENAVGHDKKE